MVSAGALRSPVPLPGWLRFNIKPSYDCAPLGSGATAVNGIKGRSCTRSALPGRRGGSGNINITPICYAQHTRVFSSARVYEPLEPGVSTTAWPLTATSPTVRKHGVATGASRRAATTQHAHESIPDASATTAFAYTTEQQQNPEDPRAGPGVPAPGPTRRRRRRNSSQEEGPRASAQHADDVASSYPGAPYLPSAPQQQRGASFANGSGGRRHAQPVSTLSHGDFSAEAGWPGTWEAPPPLPPPPPAPPAGFPAPVAVAAPPAGSVMAGWALMGDQSRMNGVYRLIRKKELQDRRLRPMQGQAGAGPAPPHNQHQQQPQQQQRRRRRSEIWRASKSAQGGPRQPPPPHTAPWAQPDGGPAQGSRSRPQPPTRGAQLQEHPHSNQAQTPQPQPLSPPPIVPTGHPGVDRVVRIRQLRLGFREKERERQREAQRVPGSSREGHRARHTFLPSGSAGSGPAVGLGSRGGGEGPAAAAAAAASATEDLIQVSLAEPEGGQQDHRGVWGGGGYFWDLGGDGGGSGYRGTDGGSGGSTSSSLLREALMSEAAQMNPVYRLIRKHELRQRRQGAPAAPGAASGARGNGGGGGSGGDSPAHVSPTSSIDPWAADDFADIMLGGLLLEPPPAGAAAAAAAPTGAVRPLQGAGAGEESEWREEERMEREAPQGLRSRKGTAAAGAGTASTEDGAQGEDGDGQEAELQEPQYGSGLNPVLRLIRKKQLQRRLRLRLGAGTGPGHGGSEAGASAASNDAQAELQEQGDTRGAGTQDAGGGGGEDWVIGPGDAVGSRAVYNPVYRLIRKKQLLRRRNAVSTITTANTAASPTSPARFDADAATWQQRQAADPRPASWPPFFNLDPAPSPYSSPPSSSPTPVHWLRPPPAPAPPRYTSTWPATGIPPLSELLDFASASNASLAASSQDSPIQVFLPDDGPTDDGRAWAGLEPLQGAPQPGPQLPAPAPAAPTMSFSVAERLSDSLVGDRPHLNHVYRLIRKKELQLRRRAAQPSPRPPAQGQQGAPAQAPGEPLPRGISASSKGPFAPPAYLEPPALLHPFDVDDGGSGAEDDLWLSGGRGGTSPDTTAPAADGARGVQSPRGARARRDASRGLAGGYVDRLLAGYDEYDSMYGGTNTNTSDEWLPYPYPYGAAWFEVGGYDDATRAAPESLREQQAEGLPAVDEEAAAEVGHVAEDASPGRRRGRRRKVIAVEGDDPGVGAAVQVEQPQEAVKRGRRRRLPSQPAAARVAAILDEGVPAGERPAVAPGGEADGAVEAGEHAVQAASGTAALAVVAAVGRAARSRMGGRPEMEDGAAGLEQRARERKPGGRGSKAAAPRALGSHGSLDTGLQASPGATGPSGAQAAEARRRRMEELKARLRARLLSLDPAPGSPSPAAAAGPMAEAAEVSLAPAPPAVTPRTAAAAEEEDSQVGASTGVGAAPTERPPAAPQPPLRASPRLWQTQGRHMASAPGTAVRAAGAAAASSAAAGRATPSARPIFRGLSELWEAAGIRVGPLPPVGGGSGGAGGGGDAAEESLPAALVRHGLSSSAAARLATSDTVSLCRWEAPEIMRRLRSLSAVLYGGGGGGANGGSNDGDGPDPRGLVDEGRAERDSSSAATSLEAHAHADAGAGAGARPAAGAAAAAAAAAAATASKQPNLLARSPAALEANLTSLGHVLGLTRPQAQALARTWPSLLELQAASLHSRLQGLAAALAAPAPPPPPCKPADGASAAPAAADADADVDSRQAALATAVATVKGYPPALGLTPEAVTARITALADAMSDGAAAEAAAGAWRRAAAVLTAHPGLLGCSPGGLSARWRALEGAVAAAEAQEAAVAGTWRRQLNGVASASALARCLASSEGRLARLRFIAEAVPAGVRAAGPAGGAPGAAVANGVREAGGSGDGMAKRARGRQPGWTSPSLSLSTALALSEARFAQRFPGYEEWCTAYEQQEGKELLQHQHARQHARLLHMQEH